MCLLSSIAVIQVQECRFGDAEQDRWPFPDRRGPRAQNGSWPCKAVVCEGYCEGRSAGSYGNTGRVLPPLQVREGLLEDRHSIETSRQVMIHARDGWRRPNPYRNAGTSLCVCMLSHFSRVQLFVTPWTVACQTPLSMGFRRQKYWSGLSFPPPRHQPRDQTCSISVSYVSYIGRQGLYH